VGRFSDREHQLCQLAWVFASAKAFMQGATRAFPRSVVVADEVFGVGSRGEHIRCEWAWLYQADSDAEVPDLMA
jgi:hypothetical protein